MNLTVSKQTQNFIDCAVALNSAFCVFSDALKEMYGSGIIEMEEEYYKAVKPLEDLIKEYLWVSIRVNMDNNGNFENGI
jgi:hypothetical protein